MHRSIHRTRLPKIGFALLALFAWSGPQLAAAPAAPDTSAEAPEPRCGVFFEAKGVEDAPGQLFLYLGLAREMAAGQDCVDTGKQETACVHFSRALEQLDKAPEMRDHVGPSIKARMQELHCP